MFYFICIDLPVYCLKMKTYFCMNHPVQFSRLTIAHFNILKSHFVILSFPNCGMITFLSWAWIYFTNSHILIFYDHPPLVWIKNNSKHAKANFHQWFCIMYGQWFQANWRGSIFVLKLKICQSFSLSFLCECIAVGLMQWILDFWI